MDDTFRIFAAIATAIVLEAMPFLALGSLLSAAIEVFLSADRIARAVPRRLAGRIALGVSAGLVVPTCECGVVPVARRLLTKGLPGPTVVAYLLSAPILNPVVLVSTFVAFRGSWTMLGARAAVAVLVAGTVSWMLRGATGADLVRRTGTRPSDHDHDHEHDHGHGHEHGHEHGAARSRFAAVWLHAAHDFLEMGKYLVVGALAAAAFKTFLPASVVSTFEGDLVLSIAGMMALAILLSVCSEADAFVAASFVTFPAAAHLAFITIGPMVDVKLIGLYAATFRRRLFLLLLVVPVVMVFLLSWLFGVLS